MDLSDVLHRLRIINVHVQHADTALLALLTLAIVHVLVHRIGRRGARTPVLARCTRAFSSLLTAR